MLLFPKNYFEGETRCGYYVESMQKRRWAGMLEVVAEIDRICRKYDITYFADYGTLLGAVRHQGFIPWDDDIDLTMKREDYERFKKVAEWEFESLSEPDDIEHDTGKLKFHSIYTTKNEYMQQVIIGTGKTIRFDEQYLTRYHGCPYSVYVEIFPLDYFPGMNEETETVLTIMEMLNHFSNNDEKWDGDERPVDEKTKNELEQIKGMIGVSFDETKSIRKQTFWLLDRMASMYNEEECDYMQNLILFPTYRHWDLYRKEWFDKVVYLPFENIDIPCPSEYDKILTAVYKDYMKQIQYARHYDEQKVRLQKSQIFKGENWEKQLDEFVSKYV